jgi:hypothetical protein
MQVLEVHGEVVSDEGAPDAALFLVGTEHEVVDYELLAAFEEVREAKRSVGALEAIFLVDFNVRELAAFFGESFACFGVFFFFFEEELAGCDPFFACSTL